MAKIFRRSNVKDGVLLPLGNGFSLVKGDHPNKVDDVDIGPNNKYGLSVNHGEILQNTGNSIRVFSAEKMLGGLSPAQLLYRGANPNIVFAAQEAYKKTHRLNDDGTHYKEGGSTQTPVKDNNDNKTVRKKIAYGNNFDSRMRYLNLDKKLVAYINKLSKDYNIPPAILTNRLFHEGAIDKAIKGYEATLGEDVSFLGLLDSKYNPTEGFSHYGLDTSFDEIKRGAVKLKRPIFARKQVNENEHGTPVNSVEVYNHYDAIETMAARLAYDREKLKADYPNVSDKVLDQMTISAYNKGLSATYKDIKNNNLNKDYIVDDRLYNINYENDFYKENKDKKHDILSFNDEEIRKDNINKYMANDLANASIRSLLNPTTYINSYKNAAKKDSDEYLYPIGTEYGYNNAIGNELIEFKLGGQTTITSPNSLIIRKNNNTNHSVLVYDKNKLGKVISHINIENPLGTIPNANSIKQMKNKRNKAAIGTQFNLSGVPFHNFNAQKYFGDYNLGTPFIPRYVDGPLKGHPILGTLRLPGTQTNFTPNTTSSDNNTPATSSTTKSNGFLGLGDAQWGNIGGTALQIAGSIGAAAINTHALNNLKFTPRQTTLLNPVKLKTKVNIAPQLAEINSTIAKITNAANKTSASSRTSFQKIAAARYAGLEAKSKLLGEKENKETALINQDRLNQQSVAHKNAERIREDINYNIAGKDNLHNQQTLGKASAWNSAINSISGAITGPNGFLDRIDARRQTATNLAAMSIVYPDAARMLYGDGYKKYFNTYYNMLRNGGI